MIRHFILQMSFFVLVNSVYSQPLTFFDDFIDNTNDWITDYNQFYTAEIKTGFYYISNKNSDRITFGKKIHFYKNGNFAIEVKIKKVAGPSDADFGFFFNADNKGNGFYFIINSSKKFSVFYEQNFNIINLTKLKYTSAIKQDKEYNILKIRKIRKKLFFYINHKLVEIKDYVPLSGEYVGFVIGDNSKIMIDYLKIYADKPPIDIVEAPITQKKENLGPAINTKYSEIFPIVSPDGKTLYFVRNNYPENTGKNKNNNDIWFSRLTDTGWTKAENIGQPLNNESHNFIFSVSPDNNKLFLNGTYTAFGEPAGNGLSVSFRQKNGTWSIPKKITIQNFYNKADYQTFTISADQKVIIMAIERDDTYGGNDLYVSFLQDDGTYSEPLNLGDSVNTDLNEGTPFLASDGKTLYFSSEGHPGYGSADIFVTKRLDDTWTKWSKPKNLGPNINTTGWDAYFSVDAKGEYAYLVSTTNSIGLEDIFRIKLQDKAKPQPVVLIYGSVLTFKDEKPLKANVIYAEYPGGNTVKTAISNPIDGEYKLVLPVGKKYLIYAQKKGYFAISKIIDLTNINDYQEINQNIYLVPIKEGQSFVLNNVYFKKGKAELIDNSFVELDRIVDFLKANPNIYVEISGHTNNIGKRSDLIKLSLQRAKVVKEYLVKKGINPNRLIIKGYGPDKPIASNTTPVGRKKNQRVEFKILKK